MPLVPPHRCAGCGALVTTRRCKTCTARRDATRPNADVRRLYHTSRWEGLKAQVRREQPLCALCAAAGHTVIATETDHKQKHAGNMALFFDRANLQGLCARHHAEKTRRGE